MNIQINEDIDENVWNKLVENKIFFRYEWLHVINNIYKLEPYFILLSEDDKFALIASFKTTKGYISLPFVSYSGFYTNDAKLLAKLKEYLQQHNIEIDARDLLQEERTEGYVNPIVQMNSFEAFWKNISSNTRNQFKKSEKAKLSFKIEYTLDNFYTLYSTGMRNLGTPTHGKSYFNELRTYFSCHIFTISKDDKAIGAMFCINDNDTLSVLYAYVLPEYSKEYANYFLYLNAIKWMTSHKLTYLDMGRSTYNEGTFHFKKKFRPKFYGINSKILYSSNSNLQLVSQIWSQLPLPVANFVGPRIRKFLP